MFVGSKTWNDGTPAEQTLQIQRAIQSAVWCITWLWGFGLTVVMIWAIVSAMPQTTFFLAWSGSLCIGVFAGVYKFCSEMAQHPIALRILRLYSSPFMFLTPSAVFTFLLLWVRFWSIPHDIPLEFSGEAVPRNCILAISFPQMCLRQTAVLTPTLPVFQDRYLQLKDVKCIDNPTEADMIGNGTSTLESCKGDCDEMDECERFVWHESQCGTYGENTCYRQSPCTLAETRDCKVSSFLRHNITFDNKTGSLKGTPVLFRRIYSFQIGICCSFGDCAQTKEFSVSSTIESSCHHSVSKEISCDSDTSSGCKIEYHVQFQQLRYKLGVLLLMSLLPIAATISFLAVVWKVHIHKIFQ